MLGETRTLVIARVFAQRPAFAYHSGSLRSPTLRHLAASLGAACASCFLMNPLDVYCTRLFHSSATPSAPAAGAGAGLRALFYTGLGANMLRTVPHTVLTFVIAGALRQRLEQLSESLSAERPPALELNRSRWPRTLARTVTNS